MSPRRFVCTLAAGWLIAATLPSTARSACPRDQLFGFPDQVGVGVFPTSIVVGRFDADALLDMAVVNLSDNNVSVSRGTGGGAFGPDLRFATGPVPRGIEQGDFNEDGILDLAVTHVGAQTVGILIGQGSGGVGNGSFAAPVSYPAGFENRGIAVADVSGDGILDLVVAARTSVAVLHGNGSAGVGDGTFKLPTFYATPSAWGLTLGDFNGDGILDVAAGNWLHPEVTVLLGNGAGGVGDGTFTAGTTIVTPGGCADITSGDLDDDGIVDLVAAGSSGVWVMLGNGSGGVGDGTFAVTPYSSGTQMNDAAIGDLDGDGHADIATTDTNLQKVRVLFGDGSGAFPDIRLYPAANGPLGIAIADVSDDGRADVLAVNSASQGYPGAVTVLLGSCPDSPFPDITSVRDVPNDQGGRVFVTWLASGLDTPAAHEITGYRVWRRIPPIAVSAGRVAQSFAAFEAGRHAVVALRQGTAVEYWEPLETIPSAFLEGYGYTAPTTQDSLAGSNPYTAFFVQALTANPFVFYSSPADSGYSVDNLSPAAPSPFVATYHPSGTALHWGASDASDFAIYRLHRGVHAAFVPDAGNLLTAQPDTGFFDPQPGAHYYYKLAAVDVHGNIGPYTELSPDGTTAVDPVAGVDAAISVPSPVTNGEVTVSLAVAAGRSANIELLDITGRLLSKQTIGPTTGRQVVRLARAAELRPGVYLVRVERAGTSVRRVVVMR